MCVECVIYECVVYIWSVLCVFWVYVACGVYLCVCYIYVECVVRAWCVYVCVCAYACGLYMCYVCGTCM